MIPWREILTALVTAAVATVYGMLALMLAGCATATAKPNPERPGVTWEVRHLFKPATVQLDAIVQP